MTKYLLNRSFQILITMVLFLTLIFFLINAQPGQISNVFALNPNVPPNARARLQEQFGQDKPVYAQFASYLKNVATGNFGVSFSNYPRPVSDIIKERLPRTLVLFVTAAVIAFYLGFAMGKIIAWRRGGLIEYTATIGGVALFTVSANHVFNNMLISAIVSSLIIIAVYVVATKLRLRYRNLITTGTSVLSIAVILVTWTASGTGYLANDILRHMVLPVATLTAISFAGTMLITRNSMLETMREDYVLAARAKGLSERQVRDKHVARNAMLPIVNNFVLSIAFAIDGGVVIETIFSWPGIGQTLVTSVQVEDLPLAVGAFMFVGIFVLLAHLIADVAYAFLDPRIRY